MPQGLPKPKQPYIPATGVNIVTISGPPATLRLLFNTPGPLQPKSPQRPAYLSVHAPYHSSFHYDKSDVDYILWGLDTSVVKSYNPVIPLFSSTTAERLEPLNIEKSFGRVLSEIILEPLQLGNVVDGIVADMKDATIINCFFGATTASVPNQMIVSPVGPMRSARMIVSSLQTENP